MSAEKCGTAISIEEFRRSERELELPQFPEPEPLIASGKAYKLLDKINKLQPGWTPVAESQIWSKARSLGLLDDEE